MGFGTRLGAPRTARVTLGVLLAILAAEAAGAAGVGPAQPPFRLEKTREAAWLGAGALLCAGGLLIHANVDPLTVDEIARLDPGDVNEFDRNAIEPYRKSHAGDALSVVSYLFPLATFARADTKRDWETIGAMWAEASLLNLGINGVVKSTVLRTRPYVYDPDTPLDKKTTTSARLSFYSGHAASAACNCFFMARVFTEYVESSKARAAMWTGAVVYPALTAYLRVDSGHHFRTDVITGYVIGAAVGYLVPELHRSRNDRVSFHPVTIDGAPGVGVRVAF